MKHILPGTMLCLILSSACFAQTLSGPANAVPDADAPAVLPARSEVSATNPERIYVTGEYLLWWFKTMSTPPLIGSAPEGEVQGGQQVPINDIAQLFGGDHGVSFGPFSGARFMGGIWLDPDSTIALEGGGFFLDRRQVNFSDSSAGDPVIGPLFVDATNGLLSILTPTDPTTATESATGSASERFWGAESNLRFRALDFGRSPIDLLVGFRYLDLASDLTYQTITNFEGAGVRVRTNQFDATTRFYGGQLGASFDLRGERWTVDVQGKLGLGTVHETANLRGQTVDTLLDGTVETFPGGVLALPSNIGHYGRSRFAVVPEVTINLGYQFTSHLRGFIGFNWLEMTLATRAGDIVDGGVNPAKIPGVQVDNPQSINRPTFQFTNSDFWALGMNFGLEFRY